MLPYILFDDYDLLYQSVEIKHHHYHDHDHYCPHHYVINNINIVICYLYY